MAKEAADAGNRTKDRFLAILSHELRTPLTPIMAIASHVVRRKDLPAEVLHDVETIRRKVSLEARIVDDLLDLTRIVRSKMELHYEVADVHAIVRASLDVFRVEIDAKRLQITSQLDARHPCVWADPARLQQIFMNLISNAVKFTPAGGNMAVSSRQDEAGRLHVEVRDTGIGFDPATPPRLFNAFEQGERTIMPLRRSGAGPFHCAAPAQMQNGQITARSDGPGRAPHSASNCRPCRSRRTPKSPQNRRRPKPPSCRGPAANASCWLKIMRIRAASWPGFWNPLDAPYPPQARSRRCWLADSQPFDLLVSDIGLPDGSGLEVMRHMQARQKIRGIAPAVLARRKTCGEAARPVSSCI